MIDAGPDSSRKRSIDSEMRLSTVSHEAGSNLSPVRTSGVVSRSGEYCRSRNLLVRWHRKPLVIGWSGSPAIFVMRLSSTVATMLQASPQSRLQAVLTVRWGAGVLIRVASMGIPEIGQTRSCRRESTVSLLRFDHRCQFCRCDRDRSTRERSRWALLFLSILWWWSLASYITGWLHGSFAVRHDAASLMANSG